jgi:Fic family protein
METSWIKFKVDLDRMGPAFWMTLGEARSKCDHLLNVPLPPEYAERLHRLALTKGVHATTAIEGNTLSEDEVAAIIRRHSDTMTGSSYREQEVQNAIAAYNAILHRLEVGERPTLTPGLIKDFNRQVLAGLDLAEEVRPGQIRKHSVVVGPYRAPDWETCESLLQQMCDWINGDQFAAEGPMRIPIAIIRASIAHLYLAWIHPFGDGNGRTARLCEYLVLVTSGIPTSAAHLISNHCNDTREEYYRQLKFASESGGNVSKFLSYCASGFVEGLQKQLEVVYERQLRLAWNDYVTTKVPGRDLDVRTRRTLVAETLFGFDFVHRDGISNLSTELARTYAKSGVKTIARDLQELVAAGLLEEKESTFRARSESLLSLLPFATPQNGNT